MNFLLQMVLGAPGKPGKPAAQPVEQETRFEEEGAITHLPPLVGPTALGQNFSPNHATTESVQLVKFTLYFKWAHVKRVISYRCILL